MRESKFNREIVNFYRVEFQRHRRRLNQQRLRYAPSTFKQVDAALGRLLGELEQITRLENFEDLAGQLLAKIDSITRLSASPTPPHRVH